MRRAGIAAGAVLVAVAAALVVALLWPAAPPPPPCAAGEVLRYTVSVIGIEAGTLDLSVAAEWEADGVPCYAVEMRITSTNRLVERFYKMRELWRSTVDRAGLFTRSCNVVRRHGDREMTDAQTFDYAAGVSRWKRLAGGREWSGEVPLAGPVQDPVSWVYYCRGRVASGERDFRFVVVERDHVRSAELRTSGEEVVDLGALGRVRALRASGSVGLGGLGAQDRQEPGVDQAASAVWFDAATGVLLKARVAAKFGAIDLVLRECEKAPPLGGAP